MTSSDQPITAAPAIRRRRLLQRMAWVCAALVLAITSLSAYIRLSKAGLGCEPWPQCYGQSLRAQQQGEPPLPAADPAIANARLAHRVIASTALLLVLVMVMAALASKPVLWSQGRLALGLLVLALFLAVLGRWTAQARMPAVTLGNLLGGFAMFALSVQMALASNTVTAPGGTPSRLARWAWWGAALLLVQVALGGLVSAGQAGLSCAGLTGCDLDAGTWGAFNPWQEPQVGAALPHNPAGAWVHLLHRMGGLVVVAVLFPLAVAAWRNGLRAVALWLLAVLALQWALGVALVTLGLPLGVALAHNMAAAVLLAVLLSIPVLVRQHPLSPAL
ncbi:COX15/CtaA family protein [Simplicispira sp. 125]|uniref:COX15/CtaA family protein n=2 Tax=unclassified Simplicispira TaxID=2630407 RepID=UPI001FAFAA83|nr:COX15/CtaA family protein [Simplicispira sp. 125]